MDLRQIGLDEVGISGLAAGGLRYLLTAKKRSLSEIIIALVVAWVVAVWTHPWALEFCAKWGFSDKSAIGLTGVVAFMAPDLLHGLLNLGKTIREEGLFSLIDRLRR